MQISTNSFDTDSFLAKYSESSQYRTVGDLISLVLLEKLKLFELNKLIIEIT